MKRRNTHQHYSYLDDDTISTSTGTTTNNINNNNNSTNTNESYTSPTTMVSTSASHHHHGGGNMKQIRRHKKGKRKGGGIENSWISRLIRWIQGDEEGNQNILNRKGTIVSTSTTGIGGGEGISSGPYHRSRILLPSGASFNTTTTTSQVREEEIDIESSSLLLQQQPVTSIIDNKSVAEDDGDHKDWFNYGLLIVLYTLQGIPMGLSASIPFLLQDKMKRLAEGTALHSAAAAATASTATILPTAVTTKMIATEAARLSYHANAIFALCSWPFSLKLLWAPIVDAIYLKQFGRRKSWLIPIQTIAGILMVGGANYVETQLGLGSSSSSNGVGSTTTTAATMIATNMTNVKGITIYFFLLYFLMATQDIAVDGWALTMLSKKNRSKGPICNSIGQNIGYFLSFVGFLAFNDPESSNTLWRPLLRLPQRPGIGLIRLKTFLQSMGYFMLITTTIVAFFKKEQKQPTQQQQQQQRDPSADSSGTFPPSSMVPTSNYKKTDELRTTNNSSKDEEEEEEHELDASEIGLRETYHRLWAVCQLPAVQWLFLILVTYRLPTALSDNVKSLKAVEWGMSKSTTALLSPALILPLGIIVPIVAAKIWHGHPLKQFIHAYLLRVTIIPVLDVAMLYMVHHHRGDTGTTAVGLYWLTIAASTAGQAICNSLQFNAQMMFFASRVDPAIGGSYMTLLNTAANLGGTWPASFSMWLIGQFTHETSSSSSSSSTAEGGGGGGGGGIIGHTITSLVSGDPYFGLQLVLSLLGMIWIFVLGPKVNKLSKLPDDAWRTHLLDSDKVDIPSSPPTTIVSPINLYDTNNSTTTTTTTTMSNLERGEGPDNHGKRA